MTIMNRPNPNEAFPNLNLPRLCFIKNVVKNPRIIIGNDVWIGQNVTVMPGVHIGDGAIIGTNSVVAKDIPPYSIAVGNPCRVVRKRFDDELIGLLLKLRWWDKSIEEIESLIPILSCGDLEKVKMEIKTRI